MPQVDMYSLVTDMIDCNCSLHVTCHTDIHQHYCHYWSVYFEIACTCISIVLLWWMFDTRIIILLGGLKEVERWYELQIKWKWKGTIWTHFWYRNDDWYCITHKPIMHIVPLSLLKCKYPNDKYRWKFHVTQKW